MKTLFRIEMSLSNEYYVHNKYNNDNYSDEYVELLCLIQVPFVPEKGMVFKFSKTNKAEKSVQIYEKAIEECILNKWKIEDGSISIDSVSYNARNNEYLIIGFSLNNKKGYNTKQELDCAVRQLIYGFGFYNEKNLLPHYSMKMRNSFAKKKPIYMHISLDLYLFAQNEKGIGRRYLYATLIKETSISFYPSKHMSIFLDKHIGAHDNPEMNRWYTVALSTRPDPISLKTYSDESGELIFLDAMYYPQDVNDIKIKTWKTFTHFSSDFDKPHPFIKDILDMEPRTPYENAVYTCISKHWLHAISSITLDSILFYSVDENCIYVNNRSFKAHTYIRKSEIENIIEQYTYGYGFKVYKKYNTSKFINLE